MKFGRSLQELAVELDRQNSAKHDYIVDTSSMFMEESGESFSLRRPLDSGIADVTPFTSTPLFHRQLGASLGIPAKYYDRMRELQPELLAHNVNTWFQSEPPEKHTIRTLDGTARAYLSDRYRRIDNFQIAEAVLPIINEMEGARVESCEVTEDRMLLKIVNPRLTEEVTKGDVVQAGIVISNSEVGLGSVSVMPLIYRLICSNGCILADGIRKYHVGRQSEEDWELFSDATLVADDHALMLKLADIVRTAVDAAKFALIVNRLRDATEAKFTAPLVSVVELSAKSFGLRDTEKQSVLEHLIRGNDLSLYGLSNAVTRTSQDVENYDRATELERIGWDVITTPPKVWRELNGVNV
jgi:hypothetical protein